MLTSLITRNFQSFSKLNLKLSAFFSFPKHDVLSMPALSPTMTEGKILKWLVKEGDKVQPGDAIAQIETDKATMTFEVQEKGFIAKFLDSNVAIPIGTPVAVLAKTSEEVSKFSGYNFSEVGSGPGEPVKQNTQPVKKEQAQAKSSTSSSKKYPSHSFLQMPAASPTMNEGKILEWKISPGDSFDVGDALFSIQTDKATVDYEATEKGVLAKIIAQSNKTLPIGQNVAVIVRKKENVAEFADFTENSQTVDTSSINSTQNKQQPKQIESTHTSSKTYDIPTDRVFASPLAKTIAKQKNVDISQIKGSGPGNRILKQDVESFIQTNGASKKQVTTENKSSSNSEQAIKSEKKESSKKSVPIDNPYQQIALTSMRKTIANRLSESKQTIPHYYVSLSIEMDNILVLRAELNKKEKENGVKISVNDIIIKAMALALRDYPLVNVQWHGNTIRQFKYADISIAVAVDGGLITPIIRRADTLGLLEISKKAKDLAKRAREGKLDPSEYLGGTSTISNLGMFGINTVTSIINPPQASILGVGKTEKKVLPGSGPDQYRVADVMDVIVSCDHRAVDGALAAQWLTRIKQYLENPTHMLL